MDPLVNNDKYYMAIFPYSAMMGRNYAEPIRARVSVTYSSRGVLRIFAARVFSPSRSVDKRPKSKIIPELYEWIRKMENAPGRAR